MSDNIYKDSVHRWVDQPHASYYVRQPANKEPGCITIDLTNDQIVGWVQRGEYPGEWQAKADLVKNQEACPVTFYNRQEAKDWVVATVRMAEVAHG